MTDRQYMVTVQRVNESAHQSAEVSLEATGVSLYENGTLDVSTANGSQFFGAGTWGSVNIVRVPGR